MSAVDPRLARLRTLAAEIAKDGEASRVAARRAFEEGLATGARGAAATSAASGRLSFDRDLYPEIIGNSKPIVAVLELIEKVAASTLPVLIQGESGTGKELIARAIHRRSPRRDKPFVTENCAAIPETLLESELFGSKRGSFTGADRDRKGLFQTADKGTLFLDEIGDMSLAMQSKLLRALQDGEIRPIGGTQSILVDVRVVSASNRLLRDLVAKNRFREDLYYRLSGVTIELPPLRDRTADVPLLAEHFLRRIAAEMRREPPRLGDSAREALVRHPWPGNIRELENQMRRCLALLQGESVIERHHLSDELAGPASSATP
jgi:serine/threonine-protein kinase PknK